MGRKIVLRHPKDGKEDHHPDNNEVCIGEFDNKRQQKLHIRKDGTGCQAQKDGWNNMCEVIEYPFFSQGIVPGDRGFFEHTIEKSLNRLFGGVECNAGNRQKNEQKQNQSHRNGERFRESGVQKKGVKPGFDLCHRICVM